MSPRMLACHPDQRGGISCRSTSLAGTARRCLHSGRHDIRTGGVHPKSPAVIPTNVEGSHAARPASPGPRTGCLRYGRHDNRTVGVTPNLRLSSRPTWRDLMVGGETRRDRARDASATVGMTTEQSVSPQISGCHPDQRGEISWSVARLAGTEREMPPLRSA
jgi:hypothetical protein